METTLRRSQCFGFSFRYTGDFQEILSDFSGFLTVLDDFAWIWDEFWGYNFRNLRRGEHGSRLLIL